LNEIIVDREEVSLKERPLNTAERI